MTSFKYPRHNLSIRISEDLDKLLEEAADDMGTSKTNIMIYLLAMFVDPTGKTSPDIEHLPPSLADDFKPRTFRRSYGALGDFPAESLEVDEQGEVFALDKNGKRVYN